MAASVCPAVGQRHARWAGALWLGLLAGCATQVPEAPTKGPADIRADVQRLLPANLPDRQGWARDIAVAFTAQGLDSSQENLCAVIAVTAQESSFRADPPVQGLPRIARREIERRTQ